MDVQPVVTQHLAVVVEPKEFGEHGVFHAAHSLRHATGKHAASIAIPKDYPGFAPRDEHVTPYGTWRVYVDASLEPGQVRAESKREGVHIQAQHVGAI